MAEQGIDADIQLSPQLDTVEKGIILESSLLMEGNNNTVPEQEDLPASSAQAYKGELPPAANLTKQQEPQVENQLVVHSPQCTSSQINGNVSCAQPASVEENRNDFAKSEKISILENCADMCISTPQPSQVPEHEQMEVSVSAQLETLSFENSLLTCDNRANIEGQQSKQDTDVSHIYVSVQAGVVEVKEKVNEDSSSSEDSSSDSDSDSTSSSSSFEPPAVLMSEGENDQKVGDKRKPPNLKTKDELLLEDLPAVDELNFTLPEDTQIEPVGIVSSIIDQLVIVQSLKDQPPLNEETVLFKKDCNSVGKVFEVFGQVSHPFYVLRFNSVENIKAKGIKMHETLYFAPTVKDFTQYIFTEQLKRQKGSDASWRNDQEPPPEALDFSDDEMEKLAKKKKKPQSHGEKSAKPGKSEDGQPCQQSPVSSMHTRGFQRRGFGPRLPSHQREAYRPPQYNQSPPSRPPVNMMHSPPMMSNPMMLCPYPPPFWPVNACDIPPFSTPPPPMYSNWSEPHMRYPPCFPNSHTSRFPGAPSSQMPSPPFPPPPLPPQGSAYRPGY